MSETIGGRRHEHSSDRDHSVRSIKHSEDCDRALDLSNAPRFGASVVGYAYGSAHRPRAAYKWLVETSVAAAALGHTIPGAASTLLHLHRRAHLRRQREDQPFATRCRRRTVRICVLRNLHGGRRLRMTRFERKNGLRAAFFAKSSS